MTTDLYVQLLERKNRKLHAENEELRAQVQAVRDVLDTNDNSYITKAKLRKVLDGTDE